ncbi:hypothetical protein J4573_27530 [Actinomadura barringtoniae]|uniref:Peptidase S1 domain-containing protein n=1 Tax=Actinomadura barringtoniae TaxID=1427535 RepID=A0A939T3B2_9ACTN|nr:hypothetical protein [Actinomadura barringtoniae]MBO2450876.1 hypothetical protein [Actinomadura barringtoniae]
MTVTATAALFGAGTPAVAAAEPAPRPISHVLPASAAKSASNYWTPERMRKAKPLPLPKRRSGTTLSPAGTPSLPSGKPRSVPPTGPTAKTSAGLLPSDVTSPQRWEGGGGITATGGKLFMHFSHGDFVCSASAVNGGNLDGISTAAHCIYDLDRAEWAQNVAFAPAYREGQEPYGLFTSRTIVMSSAWNKQTPTYENYDFAVVVANPLNGRHIVETVGGQGIVFNHVRHPYSYLFGYPGDRDNGAIMQYCSGPTFDDPANRVNHEAIHCGLNGGSSGGPLLQDFSESSGYGYIIGSNSLVAGDVNFGTYLEDIAAGVYDAAIAA